MEEEIAALQAELQVATGQGIKLKTFAAFKRFDETGDVRMLNNVVSADDPIWQGTLKMEQLTDNKGNRRMLEKLGIEDLDGYFEQPSSGGSLVIRVTTDGQREIVDVNDLQRVTGYNRTLDTRSMKIKSAQAKMSIEMRKGRGRKQIEQQEKQSRLFANMTGLAVDKVAKVNFNQPTEDESFLADSAAELRGYKNDQAALGNESVDRVGELDPETGEITWQSE
ncbi:MAG: hypothetical protein HRU18_06745 [Pseudoalteromonas sp.]|uniref:hypothetical protein n=1 Tax=Pseudoalteromonas sp. TaxID=53249 RepID=UPI001DE0BE8F|nr:hypothetical protein [Pseudoalteromonas sp.]NRA77888.1 hypothetical protein [Pseudoalteromonas sp.]